MANMSDVYGSVVINSVTGNVLKIAESINKLTKNWHYNFDLEINQEDMNQEDKHSIELGFNASGRWSFQNNIELLGKWLANTDDEDIDEAVNYLIEYDFELLIDYQEIEVGFAFIGTGSGSVTHNAGTYLSECKCENSDYTEYDLTVKNLVDILDFDEEYAREFLGC